MSAIAGQLRVAEVGVAEVDGAVALSDVEFEDVSSADVDVCVNRRGGVGHHAAVIDLLPVGIELARGLNLT